MTREAKCKACLTDSPLVSLSETINAGSTVRISEAFEDCTGLQLQSNLEYFICDKCHDLLVKFYEFRQLALRNEFYFENAAKEKPPESEIDPSEVDESHTEDHFADLDPIRDSPSYCRICLAVLSSKSQQRTHERLHVDHNGGLECDFCGRKFGERSQITSHIKSVHLKSRQVRHKCDQCPKDFTQVGSLNVHKSIEHVPNRPRLQCSQCEKGYPTKAKLNAHVRVKHENVLSSPCPHCKKCFISNTYLKQHVRAVHLKLKLHHCSHCQKPFGSKSSLINHEKLHATEALHGCDECEQAYKTRAQLKRHKLVRHSNVLKYFCEICGARFKESSGLKIHSLSHRDPSFQCSVCLKMFSRKTNLKSHIQAVHEGLKVSCDLCQQTFSSRNGMVKHQKVVHQGLRYRCGCGKEYRKRAYWAEHAQNCSKQVQVSNKSVE